MGLTPTLPSQEFPAEDGVSLSAQVRYQRDGSGNTTRVRVGGRTATTFAVEADNRLRTHDGTTASNTLRGELRADPSPKLDLETDWTAFGQLRSAQRPGHSGRFVYDGFGRLVASRLEDTDTGTVSVRGYAWMGNTLLYTRFPETTPPCDPTQGPCDGDIIIGDDDVPVGGGIGPRGASVSDTDADADADADTEEESAEPSAEDSSALKMVSTPAAFRLPRQIYVYGPRQRAPVWASDPTVLHFPSVQLDSGYSVHSDLMGTARLVTAKGQTLAFTDPDPFGGERARAGVAREVGSIQTYIPFGYGAHLQFSELGVVNMRARWYAPDLQRFLSPDPLGFVDGSNRFLYVGGNPFRWMDPTGLARDGVDRSPDYGPSSDASSFSSGGFNPSLLMGSAILGPTHVSLYQRAPAACAAGDSVCALGRFHQQVEARSQVTGGQVVRKSTQFAAQTYLSVAGGALGRTGQAMEVLLYGSLYVQALLDEGPGSEAAEDEVRTEAIWAAVPGPGELDEIIKLNRFIRAVGDLAVEDIVVRATARGSHAGSPVGKAIQKHAARPNTVFKGAGGNHNKNTEIGEAFLRDLLTRNDAVMVQKLHPTHGNVFSVRRPDGAGAMFKEDGTFIQLLEAYTPRPPATK